MIKRFNKRFGIEESLEEERARFVQRINQIVFKEIEVDNGYEKAFRTVCYGLGENADDRIPYKYGMRILVPDLRTLTNDDFFQTLKILESLYLYFNKEPGRQIEMSEYVERALSNAAIDLEVAWKDGVFYPRGAKILDEKLVEDPIDWLDEFPEEKKDFENALSHYAKKNHSDVVGDCYLVTEGLVRKILGNTKTLDNNKQELLKKLGLSQSWKSVLVNYMNYANEFKRHASKKRHSIDPLEVEAFLYLTGLLTRLIVQSDKT
jgi:hypothetical protein